MLRKYMRRGHCCWVLSLAIFMGMQVLAEGLAPMPWDLETLSRVPATWPAEGFEEAGVQALFYAGAPYEEKDTRVFAWYGAPNGTQGEQFPAMVLVHGGGGTAFAEWVRLWTGRGYCAIAMDTCGCVPRGAYGNWERHAHGGPAGWGGFHQSDVPIEDQWTYHAVANIIRAHSLLRSFPEVDAERTGITGISWGGYLTCIAAGVDARFKLAAPVYGCGFLGENSVWRDTFAEMGEEKSAAWLSLWDPSVYLARAAMPFLWVTGTNDFAYPLDSLQKSYRLPSGPRTLCIRVRMPHGHHGPGENPKEIHVFANSVLDAQPSLPRIIDAGQEEQTAWVMFADETDVVGAELVYTRDAGKWEDRLWEVLPAAIERDTNKASADVPEGTTVYYMNLTDAHGHVVSSEHREL